MAQQWIYVRKSENKVLLKENWLVLVVNNNPLSAELWKQHLINLGSGNILICTTVDECRGALAKKPNLILCDAGIFDLNVKALLKDISTKQATAYTVMFFEQNRYNEAVQSLSYGAFDFVIKGENELLRLDTVLYNIVESSLLQNTSQMFSFRKLFSLLSLVWVCSFAFNLLFL